MLTSSQKTDLRFLGNASEDAEAWYQTYDDPKWEAKVFLEVPLGEITENWALGLIANINGYRVMAIDGHEGFSAQGLEGKVVIPMSYRDALLRSRMIVDNRYRITQRLDKRR